MIIYIFKHIYSGNIFNEVMLLLFISLNFVYYIISVERYVQNST
jgi:hypothetical protein